MQTLKLGDGKNALVIVAHPDDETIWFGGAIMKNPQIKWTIFSLCRSSDTDREPKFQKVCKQYNAEAIITDLDDDEKLTINQTIPIIKKYIKDKLNNQNFDYLFTHGANGEYGHDRHIGVHQAVTEMIHNQELNISTGFYFNYKKIENNKDENNYNELIKMEINDDSDYILKLTKEELAKKKEIVAKIYGYDYNGIDVNLCTNPEGFKIIK
jgi:LmbE family N-acetylglucosaminyl deacetylase